MVVFIKKRLNIKANTKKLCKNCNGINNRPKSDFCCKACTEEHAGRLSYSFERNSNFTMTKGW